MHSSLGKSKGTSCSKKDCIRAKLEAVRGKNVFRRWVAGANVLFRKLGAINDILLKEGLAA